MKKLILFFIFTFILVYVYKQMSIEHQVIEIISPVEIYVDINRNQIRDEKSPITLDNIFYIKSRNDFSEFPILKELNVEEKFLLEYLAKDYSQKILNNKFIKIKNNEIYINNKKYKKLLLDSNLFFTNDKNTQKNLINKIKELNVNDYIIYNLKTKKYHYLDCESGRNSSEYILIKKENIHKNTKICEHRKIKNELIQNNKFSDTYKSNKINIFFINFNETKKPNNKCNTTACKELKDEINNATKSIDFAIYGINNQPEIISALVKAKQRGVKIRWVCDYNKESNNYYPDTEKLKKSISTYTTDEEYEKYNQSAIMHNKFFIFDNKKVWTGSSNITSTDLSGFNANYSILIDNEKIAQIYAKEFEQMYNGLFHIQKQQNTTNIVNIDENTKIEVLFSPQDNIVKNKLIPIINKAERYIYIPIFFITNKDISSALINANKRGVEIKIINDATNSHGKHSEHKLLRKNGIKVKTENKAGKMHMKSMFIDDKISIISSMNFTKSGNNKNDENLTIIYNKEITEYLKNTFIIMWNDIPKKYEHFDPRAESFDSIGSCYDGIDNNFDNKVDMNDIGCKIK